MELQKKEAATKLAIQAEINRKQEAEEKAKKQAEVDMQKMLDVINAAAIARDTAKFEAGIKNKELENAAAQAHEKAMADIETAKQKAYADTVQQIMESITPELIAALEVGGKCDLMETIAKHMSPYAIAKGESVVEATQKLMNGLPFDVKEIVSKFNMD